MTADGWRQVKDLYERARALTGEERRALLDAQCSRDDEVRREVEALLAAPEPDDDFLETPLLAAGALAAYAGRGLGPYEGIRGIGSGGTSTVYEAFRRDGHYEQRVAIKLVRADMDREF